MLPNGKLLTQWAAASTRHGNCSCPIITRSSGTAKYGRPVPSEVRHTSRIFGEKLHLRVVGYENHAPTHLIKCSSERSRTLQP